MVTKSGRRAGVGNGDTGLVFRGGGRLAQGWTGNKVRGGAGLYRGGNSRIPRGGGEERLQRGVEGGVRAVAGGIRGGGDLSWIQGGAAAFDPGGGLCSGDLYCGDSGNFRPQRQPGADVQTEPLALGGVGDDVVCDDHADQRG